MKMLSSSYAKNACVFYRGCLNHMHLNFIQTHFGCSERCSDSDTNQPQGFKLGCHGSFWIICFLFLQIVILCVSTSLPWGMAAHWTFSAALELARRVVLWVCKKLQCSTNGALGLSEWMSQTGGIIWTRTPCCWFCGNDDRALLSLKDMFQGLVN